MSSTFPTELDQIEIEPVGSPSIQWGIITPGSIDPSQWHRKEGSLTFSVEVQCSACNTLHDFSLMLDYEAQSDAYKRFKALSTISGAVVTCTNAGCAKTLAIPFAKYTESRLILPFNPKTSTNTVKTLMNGRAEAASKGSDAHRSLLKASYFCLGTQYRSSLVLSSLHEFRHKQDSGGTSGADQSTNANFRQLPWITASWTTKSRYSAHRTIPLTCIQVDCEMTKANKRSWSKGPDHETNMKDTYEPEIYELRFKSEQNRTDIEPTSVKCTLSGSPISAELLQGITCFIVYKNSGDKPVARWIPNPRFNAANSDSIVEAFQSRAPIWPKNRATVRSSAGAIQSCEHEIVPQRRALIAVHLGYYDPRINTHLSVEYCVGNSLKVPMWIHPASIDPIPGEADEVKTRWAESGPIISPYTVFEEDEAFEIHSETSDPA